jgi:hypothetical protein
LTKQPILPANKSTLIKVLANTTLENETLAQSSLCYLLIYFRKMLRGNAIIPYPGISFEIGEHPADFRPGNSKGAIKCNESCYSIVNYGPDLTWPPM